jgi:hypothetical protein
MFSSDIANQVKFITRTLVGTALTVLACSVAVAHSGEKIRILNEQGLPIIGADVMVGHESGKPFTNNLLKTDSSGAITVTDEWQSTQPITVSATGYLRTTFLNVEPQANEFQLHTVDVMNQVEIKGTTTSFPEFKRDGKVNFGLVYPALHRTQLAQFDMNSFLSPQFDQIHVITQTVSIPSNLTLPEQQQSYILPITLNKPDYRLYVRSPGGYRVMANHGQFPFKQVVSALRDGKAFYEVLNLFKFTEYGQRDVVVNDKIDGQDIPVNQVQVTNSINVQAPTLAADQVMLSASLVSQGDMYFMSDIKRVESGQTMSLGTPAGQNTNEVVSLLMPTKEASKIGGIHTNSFAPQTLSDINQNTVLSYKLVFDRFINILGTVQFDDEPPVQVLNDGPGGLSIAMSSAGETQPSFLNLVSRPTLSNDGKTVSFAAPAMVNGITPIATYVVLSQIDHTDMGQYKVEHRFRLWELYNNGWTNQVNLPKVALSTQPGKNYRWEVYFLGSTQVNAQQNTSSLDKVTHVSHNSLDL